MEGPNLNLSPEDVEAINLKAAQDAGIESVPKKPGDEDLDMREGGLDFTEKPDLDFTGTGDNTLH